MRKSGGLSSGTPLRRRFESEIAHRSEAYVQLRLCGAIGCAKELETKGYRGLEAISDIDFHRLFMNRMAFPFKRSW